jgi:hypothetical protein
MTRKKWTAQEEVTASLLTFREKRKWQLALRRYIIERNPSEFYAPFFAIDIEHFRQWIALQFSDGMGWDNFGKKWQFEHIVPLAYFDLTSEEELGLCWHFINIRVQPLNVDIAGSTTSVLAAKSYFAAVYQATGFLPCLKMVKKIESIENRDISLPSLQTSFLQENKQQLEDIATLTAIEFTRLNKGMNLQDLILEREILQKFG